jgi:inner membrane transporter RhtA
MSTPAPALAIASMVIVQFGSALSTHLFDAVGPAGSAWLRLAFSGLVLLALTRPRLGQLSRRALVGVALLGVTTAVLSLAFIESLARIPLGTAVAVEFLGPLGVSALRAQRRGALAWPALALAGVVALTRPWAGGADPAGIGFALAAAAGWAGYLVLTQRVGAEVEGLRPLALSMTAGAVVAAPLAAGPALAGLTPSVALLAAGTAVLSPLLPYVLELAALRRMSLAAFGTLMALEPGIATVLGLLVLAQAPSGLQAGGVLLVVAAGIGAQRSARTCPASAPASVEGRSQTNPRHTYAAA